MGGRAFLVGERGTPRGGAGEQGGDFPGMREDSPSGSRNAQREQERDGNVRFEHDTSFPRDRVVRESVPYTTNVSIFATIKHSTAVSTTDFNHERHENHE